ncbi:MAG: glucose-6-phosphate dehydrogenase [Verrucomicrobiia bacterium]
MTEIYRSACDLGDGMTVTPPFAMVIFGASGDLTVRKLMPALFHLYLEKRLPEIFQIVGFARRSKTDEQFRAEMKEGVKKFSRSEQWDENAWAEFESHVFYSVGEFPDASAYERLQQRLLMLPGSREVEGHYLFYLATAPEYFGVVAHHLYGAGLFSESKRQKLIVEKPFGIDGQTAEKLTRELQAAVAESSLYRIDHYLGKETVQNLLYFRFANSIYEPLWNRRYIDHVQITVAESEGVGSRGGYFDKAGSLRDMFQNHMMQLLALTAMEPPASLDAESLRNEKVKVLCSIPDFQKEQLSERVVRGQYDGYRNEERVDPKSMTETYVAVKLFVDNWRWSEVPFYLRTGKFLKHRTSEIVVVFRRPPSVLFQAKCGLHLMRNTLRIRLQPDEGIHLCFNAKTPGRGRIESVDMDFKYALEFGSYSPEAYERLLYDALVGDSTLFTRADEVKEAWRIVDSIQNQWQDQPMHTYVRGSWGPEAADQLMTCEGNRWLTEEVSNRSTSS